MHKEYVTFTSRQDRMAYVARRFAPLLQESVLDVGCDQAYLREMLDSADYTGVDLAANADVVQNLETTPRLPFPDRHFDCVLCIDVLEHLNSLHTIFQELLRTSKRHVVISWHNCWVNARLPLERGRGSFSHYGLPHELPLDRHKWFFNITEAWSFVKAHQGTLHYSIAEAFVTEKPRPCVLRLARHMRWPRAMSYNNRYAHTLWTVLHRH